MSRSSTNSSTASAVSGAVAVSIIVATGDSPLPLWGRILMAMLVGIVVGVASAATLNALRARPRKA